MKKHKDLKVYPTRGFTLSDEVWLELKKQKNGHGGNWNAFIKSLLIKETNKNDKITGS